MKHYKNAKYIKIYMFIFVYLINYSMKYIDLDIILSE